jgi:glutaredoxin-related protein
VVNVLDEVHNPGLRETIKTFSQWPTIPQVGSNATLCTLVWRTCNLQCTASRHPQHTFHAARMLCGIISCACPTMLCCCSQLYVNGELVGGADIVTEMAEKGELQPLLRGQ